MSLFPSPHFLYLYLLCLYLIRINLLLETPLATFNALSIFYPLVYQKLFKGRTEGSITVSDIMDNKNVKDKQKT